MNHQHQKQQPKKRWQSLQACRAAEQGVRCRTLVEPPEKYCQEHSGTRKKVETPPPPTVILIKFFGLDKDILEILEEAGVPRKPYKPEKEREHEQEAEERGIDFRYYNRPHGDTGTAIFAQKEITITKGGEKEKTIYKASFIAINEAVIELSDIFDPTDIHIKERAEGERPVLVVTFSRTKGDVELPKPVMDRVYNLLTTEKLYGRVGVFANPPKNDKALHTINCDWWGELEPRRFINLLKFDKGLWNIEQKPVEERPTWLR